MISYQQVRAGRSLLGWTQGALAKAAKISLKTLNNVERGAVTPNNHTLSSLTLALENGGIEFTDAVGVRLKQEVLEIVKYEGPNCLRDMHEDILRVLKDGEELLCFNFDEEKLAQYDLSGVHTFYYDTAKARGITERILTREGNTFTIGPIETYRWLPKEFAGEVPYMVYGDTMGMALLTKPMRLVLIRNVAVAETYRQQFNVHWKNAKPLKPAPSLKTRAR